MSSADFDQVKQWPVIALAAGGAIDLRPESTAHGKSGISGYCLDASTIALPAASATSAASARLPRFARCGSSGWLRLAPMPMFSIHALHEDHSLRQLET